MCQHKQQTSSFLNRAKIFSTFVCRVSNCIQNTYNFTNKSDHVVQNDFFLKLLSVESAILCILRRKTKEKYASFQNLILKNLFMMTNFVSPKSAQKSLRFLNFSHFYLLRPSFLTFVCRVSNGTQNTNKFTNKSSHLVQNQLFLKLLSVESAMRVKIVTKYKGKLKSCPKWYFSNNFCTTLNLLRKKRTFYM